MNYEFMNPVLLIAIPLLIAFISVLFKKISKILLLLTSIFNVVSLFTYEFGSYVIGGFEPPFGINLYLDLHAFVALILVNGLFLLALIINQDKIKNMSTVLLIALAGLNGLILTQDLFNLFVFLEISGIAAYIITTQNKKLLYSFQYLVLGTVGSGLYLLGLIMLYGMIGSLNMANVTERLGSVDSTQVMIPILFMFIGLAVEAKLIPFNAWVKGILKYSNSLVGTLIASIYAGTTLFVFGRVLQVFEITDQLLTVLVVIGVITLIAGEFAAFSSQRLREVLLFSSIAQAGLIVVLFLNQLELIALLLIISNVLSKFILFTIAGRIADVKENDDIDELKGLFIKHKLIGFSFSVAALSIAGLPLFYGFIAKINTLYQLFINDHAWLTAIILLTSVIEGSYFIRILVKLWNPGEEGEVSSNKQMTSVELMTKPLTVLTMMALALVIIVLGVLPFDADLLDMTSNSGSPVKIIEQWGGILR